MGIWKRILDPDPKHCLLGRQSKTSSLSFINEARVQGLEVPGSKKNQIDKSYLLSEMFFSVMTLLSVMMKPSGCNFHWAGTNTSKKTWITPIILTTAHSFCHQLFISGIFVEKPCQRSPPRCASPSPPTSTTGCSWRLFPCPTVWLRILTRYRHLLTHLPAAIQLPYYAMYWEGNKRKIMQLIMNPRKPY